MTPADISGTQSANPIWQPDPAKLASTQIAAFARFAGARTGADLSEYHALHAWSVDDVAGFWSCVADFFQVPGVIGNLPALTEDRMPGAVWFPGARLNYVDQVLRHCDLGGPAIIEIGETGGERHYTWSELADGVYGLAASLQAKGVHPGDRVVGYLPNCAAAVIAFLATAALGAIWSGCGMDYAPSAALARFRQLAPKVLIAADGYSANGKVHGRGEAVSQLQDGLPSLEAVIVENRISHHLPAGTLSWTAAVQGPAAVGSGMFTPARVPFDHPLWVLFTSGTTGPPKGIMHGHGGVVLEHLKALALHCDIGPGQRYWWYTTPSWMMWNFQVSGLLTGTTIVCYDGSPTYPAVGALWATASRLGVSLLGTSPGYLAACAKAGIVPKQESDLACLRTLGVTGSTLPASSYHWVRDTVGTRVQVASITGGTDVATAFAGSAPTVPVWAGEISAAWLGIALDSFDSSGLPVRSDVGELVITKPMPSMPVGFWKDPGRQRYQEAYFGIYPRVWRHGDWVTITARGTIRMHGRSDATLNRNGIRMGTAEIYEAVEAIPDVIEALIIGIDEPEGHYWMPLFVTLHDGLLLTDALKETIRSAIRTRVSPRHVPDDIICAPGVPHTRTGKKLEVPIKRLMTGRHPGLAADRGGVDRPELLDWYASLARQRRLGS